MDTNSTEAMPLTPAAEPEARIRTRNDSGASAVEYGLLVAGIAALVVGAVFLFGGALNSLMGDSCGTITAFVTGANC